MSNFTEASTATLVSVLAAQQTEMPETVNRPARSVDSLSQNSADPSQILELTDRLNMLSVNSPNNTYLHQIHSPNYRQTTPNSTQQHTYQSRLTGTGRFGPFTAPAAYQHQQAPKRSNIPLQQPLPSFFPPRPLNQPTQPVTPTQYPNSSPSGNANFYESSTPWGEPEPVSHLVFTGKSNELRRFLVEIIDAICPHQARFMTDSRRINWVAQHFMIRDYKVSGIETASQNWLDSLLASNAQQQGR